MNAEHYLPIIFMGLMGLAILIYAILDGYDLGVGILLPRNSGTQRDRMIASIGPFWDANETWLVLGVGLLLIAFPSAYNTILRELYLPSTIMLCGLILRGVAFDFRAKVGTGYLKQRWDNIFRLGSIITTLSQGYMLGLYVVGFEATLAHQLFASFSALCVTAAYTYIGSSWLIMKTENDLQTRAIFWARRTGWLMSVGVALVSLVNLIINPDILDKWQHTAYGILLLPVPLVCFGLFFLNDRVLRHMAKQRLSHHLYDSTNTYDEDNKNTEIEVKTKSHNDALCWLPFCNTVVIFILCFIGLAFSFYPYVIPQQLTIWQAASAPESLQFLLWGAIFVIPTILLYTAFSYRVFWGKAKALDYY